MKIINLLDIVISLQIGGRPIVTLSIRPSLLKFAKGRHKSKTEPARPLCELKSAFSPGWRPESARSLRAPPRFLGIGRRSQGTETCYSAIFKWPNIRPQKYDVYKFWMSYLCEERTSEDARQDVGRSPPERRPGVVRASTDLLLTDRNSEGAHAPLYRPGFSRLPLVYWRAPGDFWSLVFERAPPEPRPKCDRVHFKQKICSTPWRIWNSATFGRSTITAGDRWICDVGIRNSVVRKFFIRMIISDPITGNNLAGQVTPSTYSQIQEAFTTADLVLQGNDLNRMEQLFCC